MSLGSWTALLASALIASACECARAGPVAIDPSQEAPLRTVALDGVERVALGYTHGCALVRGAVWCWGTPRSTTSATGPAHVATRVEGLADIVDVRAGGRQTCALARTGELHCWGERFEAPPADAPSVVAWNPLDGPPASVLARYHEAPVRVAIEHVTAFDVGRAHACALDAARVLSCWGSNANDEIGADASHAAPHRVAEDVVSMRAGPVFTCWRTRDERETCIGVPPEPEHRGASWASHTKDPIVATTCSLRDRRVTCTTPGAGGLARFPTPAFDDVEEVALGAYHACLRRADASVWCWGDNTQNQLGRPADTGSEAAAVAGVRARQIDAGQSHACALTEAGTVVCWGTVEGGAIGVDPTGAMTSSPAPQLIQRRDG